MLVNLFRHKWVQALCSVSQGICALYEFGQPSGQILESITFVLDLDVHVRGNAVESQPSFSQCCENVLQRIELGVELCLGDVNTVT